MKRFTFIGLTAIFLVAGCGGYGSHASEPEYYDEYGDAGDDGYTDDYADEGYVEEAPVYDEYGDASYDAAPEWVDENAVGEVEDFYEPLDAYGDWEETDEYGRVWHPSDPEFEAPYVDGYWAESDAGVVYMSDAPYGWAVYHYGRWILTPRGWAWVPDTYWAPSWVEWRVVDGYIGWAPLAPAGYVYHTWAHWSFIPHTYFGHRHWRQHVVHHAHARDYYHRSRPIVRYHRARAGYRYPAGPGSHWRSRHGVSLPRPAHRRVTERPAHVPRHRARPISQSPPPRPRAGDRRAPAGRRDGPPPRGHQPAGRAPSERRPTTPTPRRGTQPRGVQPRRGSDDMQRRQDMQRREQLQRRERDVHQRQEVQRREQVQRREREVQQRQESQRREQMQRRQETERREQMQRQRREPTRRPTRSERPTNDTRRRSPQPRAAPSRSAPERRATPSRSERRATPSRRAPERRATPSRSAPQRRGAPSRSPQRRR